MSSTSTPAGSPAASPTSSIKRARSADSRTNDSQSARSPAALSTHSLASAHDSLSAVTATATATTAALDSDPTPYPAFLRLAAAAHDKWNDLEWAQLQRVRDAANAAHADHPHPWARCNTDEHAPRNRYANVDPYQAHRVCLDVPDGHSDYINASPISLESTRNSTPLCYIATQGPREDSWSHIWRMIWRETVDPAVVVMLTRTHEMGREKCFPYYPQSLEHPDMPVNEHDEFQDAFTHNLHLASLTHDDEARTDVREIDMANQDGSDSRKIWHLLFEGWPDFSVPEGDDKDALLKLINISREKNPDNATNPRIIHCSAGIGRSGTFIALDWLIQELYEGALDEVPDDQDPVLNVVEMLRDQRPMMVQSKSQFLFIYDVLRERWRERWVALNPEAAAELGVTAASTPDGEPALKRQKSAIRGDAAARAELEAELMDADLEYEKGKT
jgi:protein-tyrosine phosphatase